jgi:hypothetical protein
LGYKAAYSGGGGTAVLLPNSLHQFQTGLLIAQNCLTPFFGKLRGSFRQFGLYLWFMPVVHALISFMLLSLDCKIKILTTA